MKKTVIVGIICVLTTVSLTGCNWFQEQDQVADETDTTQQADTVADDGLVPIEDKSEVDDQPVKITDDIAKTVEDWDSYEDSSIPVPLYCDDEEKQAVIEKASANGVKQLILDRTKYTNLTLTLTDNPDKLTTAEFKEMFMPCVEGVGANAPLKAVDDHLLWGFPHCTGGALVSTKESEKAYDDCEDIRLPLDKYLHTEYGEHTLEGEYTSIQFSGNQILFTTDEMHYVRFTNSDEEVRKIMGLEDLPKCGDHSGLATIVVKNIEEIPGPGESTYEVELVKLVESSDPVTEVECEEETKDTE